MKKATIYITETIDGVTNSYKQEITIDNDIVNDGEDTIEGGGNEPEEADQDRKVPRKRIKL